MNIIKGLILTFSSLFEKKYRDHELIGDRYEIKEFLGKGSYGCSYLVFDRRGNHLVVLKMLRFHKRLTPSGRASFRKEMNMLKSITHESFPKFFEEGVYKNVPFFTMEYVNGKTFEQLIFREGKTYSEVEAFTLGLELLSLISIIHEKGIIHRDIRIPNIMMDGDHMKLIDFGLARFKKGINRERPLPVPKAIDPISDYYGLGHFLLFLLYSEYTPHENEKEKSWEEELSLSPKGKHIIKRLLLTETPYESTTEIQQDIENMILENRRNGNVIF